MSIAEFSVSFELNFAQKEDIAKIAISGELHIEQAQSSHRTYSSPITYQDLGSLRESPTGRERSSPKKVRRNNQGRLDEGICFEGLKNKR